MVEKEQTTVRSPLKIKLKKYVKEHKKILDAYIKQFSNNTTKFCE